MNTQIIYVLVHIKASEETAIFIIGIFLTAYNFAAFCFVMVLLTFHCFLINKNITTAEFCNDSWV